MTEDKFYSEREEKANYLTHAVGVLMSLLATTVLVSRAATAVDHRALISYTIFGIGMITCMSASTLYHYIKAPLLKAKLRHYDHASIYLLIAASYSPFTLMLLRDTPFWGWFIFVFVWIIALVGIILSFRPLKRNNHLKTLSYVLMGLIVLIAFKPLIEAAQAQDAMNAVIWIIVGGIFYIAGALIYAIAKREFTHSVFHIFVLLGLASHIYAAYLIPL